MMVFAPVLNVEKASGIEDWSRLMDPFIFMGADLDASMLDDPFTSMGAALADAQ